MAEGLGIYILCLKIDLGSHPSHGRGVRYILTLLKNSLCLIQPVAEGLSKYILHLKINLVSYLTHEEELSSYVLSSKIDLVSHPAYG